MAMRTLAVLLLVACASCYDPRVRARLTCGPHGECPGAQRCVENVCGGELPDAGDADADLGPYELTVVLAGPAGVGLVRSDIEGIDCGVTCEHSYDPATQVRLRITLTNGSNLRFAGWRGACAGVDTECLLSMDGNRVVTAEFAVATHNLVFVTRNTYNVQMLTANAFDASCNGAATGAGLNNGSNDGFRAWVSDETSTGISDLGSARGWVRSDGLPVFDTLTDLAQSHILHPIDLDEGGREVLAQVVTGTQGDATLGDDCTSWAGGGRVTLGQSWGGPTTWTEASAPNCSTITRGPIYCFQRTLSNPLLLTGVPSGGKRIFVTRALFTPNPGGIGNADQLCAGESPTGPPFRALLQRDGQPAGSLLSPSQSYYTMTGQLIGSGRELAENERLHTGIWQHSDGGFLDATLVGARRVQTGSARPSQTGSDCTGWTSTAGSSTTGLATDTIGWWATALASPCSGPSRLYCVEQ